IYSRSFVMVALFIDNHGQSYLNIGRVSATRCHVVGIILKPLRQNMSYGNRRIYPGYPLMSALTRRKTLLHPILMLAHAHGLQCSESKVLAVRPKWHGLLTRQVSKRLMCP